MDTANNINSAWVTLLKDLLMKGQEVSPKGELTKELQSFMSVIDMNSPVITIPERKMNYDFMFGEAYYILSGSNRAFEITQFMKAIGNYSDDGITFNGAYGPKVMEQISYVANTLHNDPESRQALLTIWRERPASSRDIPCTISLQFMIRDGKLNCYANMRSSDAWLGWVYDVFNFSMIAHYVGAWLNIIREENDLAFVDIGHLFLNAASQHLYEKHFDQAAKIVNDIVNHKSSYTVFPSMYHQYTHPDVLVKDLLNAGWNKPEEIECPMKAELSGILRELGVKNESKAN